MIAPYEMDSGYIAADRACDGSGLRTGQGAESAACRNGKYAWIRKSIGSGNLYELTENNFQAGLDYDFSEEELAIWQALLEAADSIAEPCVSEEISAKYLIRLYDADGSEVAAFALDQEGKLYSEDGRRIEYEAVTELLQAILPDAES